MREIMGFVRNLWSLWRVRCRLEVQRRLVCSVPLAPSKPSRYLHSAFTARPYPPTKRQIHGYAPAQLRICHIAGYEGDACGCAISLPNCRNGIAKGNLLWHFFWQQASVLHGGQRFFRAKVLRTGWNAKCQLRFRREGLTAAFLKFPRTLEIWAFRSRPLASHLSFPPCRPQWFHARKRLPCHKAQKGFTKGKRT